MDERCSCHPQADENVKLPIPTSNLIYLHSSQILFFSSVFCFFVNYFHHLTVITSEPSFNICTSYQRLMPHRLRIMQTIAYSTKTCPPSTHIVWKAPPQSNCVIYNECRARVYSLADCLGMKDFLQTSVFLHAHKEELHSRINDPIG